MKIKLLVTLISATITVSLTACKGDIKNGDAGDAGIVDEPPVPGEVFVLPRPSRSSAIAISPDDSRVVMTNPEDGSISIFNAETNQRIANIATGLNPSSVAIHPNGFSVFVANRGDSTVTRIDNLGAAAVVAEVEVGSEPTGIALSPTGSTLYVAEWAESRVSVIDTATMELTQTIGGVRNPRALTVTNDGDEDDGDERLIVTEFYGRIIDGKETADDGRTGVVRVFDTADLKPAGDITFSAVDSGFAPVENGPTVETSPNQLYAVAINKGRIYVPSVSASPAPPVKFNGNVFPVVYVADLETLTEDRSAHGTTNLAALVKDSIAPGEERFFLADIVDVAFVPGTDFAYVLSRGADVIQRVVYQGEVSIGSTFNVQIEIGDNFGPNSTPGCRGPIAITTAHDSPTAYVNCWISRRLGVVDLSNQSLVATTESTALPIDEAGQEIHRGRKFFFTGRARWSSEAWSACSSCHPDGLSDNITWSFAAGPRQATSLDGSFSKGPGLQKQRVLNWTGIFDELHDFERNTRNVSGGLGALTESPTDRCGNLAEEVQVTLGSNLAQPLKELQNCNADWDAINEFVRTITPPKARQGLDRSAVDRGRILFGEGGCDKCHGGAGFTVSRRFFTPSTAQNSALAQDAFAAPGSWPPTWNLHSLQTAVQPAAADNNVAQGPAQVACVIRNVGTFGTEALEKRDSGTRAQGAGGYNIPSLYGLQVGAPYFHHGQAATLADVLNNPLFSEHLTAGNAVFALNESESDDLEQYLLSVDSKSEEHPIPSGFDGCPE